MASRCFSVFALCACCGISGGRTPLFSQTQPADRTQTESLARRAGERLTALQREADRLASDERTLLNELRRLEVERQLKAEELKQIDQETRQVERDLGAIATRVDTLRESQALQAPELRARLVEIYKLGRARYLRLLLSAPDARHIGQASRMVAALAATDRERIGAHQQTVTDLKSARATLEERKMRLDVLRSAAVKSQQAAQRAVDARTALVHDIDARRDLNAQLSGELQAAQQKLQLALRDLGTGPAAADSIRLPLKPFRGDLDWPVAGRVRRHFSRPAFQGIQLSASEGTEVLAIHEGIVAFADSFAGFGTLVILDHGSQAFSLYGDLLDVAVSKGARVHRGQPIGTTGSTPDGISGLYFELRVDGQPVDPLQWLKTKP
jgi:septal ring factor EnvC (AmiA/AmiB activator)